MSSEEVVFCYRFFDMKKPFKKTDFFDQMSLPHSDKSIKLVSPENEEATDHFNVAAAMAEEKHTKLGETTESMTVTDTPLRTSANDGINDNEIVQRSTNDRTSSPYGSFSFNGRKTALFRASHSSHTLAGETHKTRANYGNNVLRTSKSETKCSNYGDDSSSVFSTQTSSVDATSGSERSVSLWSIDSYCMTSQQSLITSQQSLNTSQSESDHSATLNSSDSAAVQDTSASESPVEGAKVVKDILA